MNCYNLSPEGPSSLKQEQPEHRAPKPIRDMLFDAYEMNVKPFVLPRALDTYKHFIMIFHINTSDPMYDTVKKWILSWLHQTKFIIGENKPVSFEDSTTGLKLSNQKVYLCDIRSQKDPDCGLHLQLHREPWINDAILSTYLDKYRGLIVFADDMNTIPSCWYTKSIAGLTTSPDLNTFLKKGLGYLHYYQVQKPKNAKKLCGYIKMIRNFQYAQW